MHVPKRLRYKDLVSKIRARSVNNIFEQYKEQYQLQYQYLNNINCTCNKGITSKAMEAWIYIPFGAVRGKFKQGTGLQEITKVTNPRQSLLTCALRRPVFYFLIYHFWEYAVLITSGCSCLL